MPKPEQIIGREPSGLNIIDAYMRATDIARIQPVRSNRREHDRNAKLLQRRFPVIKIASKKDNALQLLLDHERLRDRYLVLIRDNMLQNRRIPVFLESFP